MTVNEFRTLSIDTSILTAVEALVKGTFHWDDEEGHRAACAATPYRLALPKRYNILVRQGVPYVHLCGVRGVERVKVWPGGHLERVYGQHGQESCPGME
jgi:hypothetical protein